MRCSGRNELLARASHYHSTLDIQIEDNHLHAVSQFNRRSGPDLWHESIPDISLRLGGASVPISDD